MDTPPPQPVAIAKPSVYYTPEIESEIKSVFTSKLFTNGDYVKRLEEGVKQYTGVKNCVAVSSATNGLILALKAMKLTGEVILPSFTFTASGLSLLWNNLKPVLVDIEEGHFCISPDAVNEAITEKTSAIMAVHVFGQPANVKALTEIAEDNDLKLIFDSAHAFGSSFEDTKIGSFGDAEVFSCSPTKPLTTGEGGLITTTNDRLAAKLRLMRNYGITESYDCLYQGLNARMTEINAIIGHHNLQAIDKVVTQRNSIAAHYLKELSHLDGISFQKKRKNCVSTYKDFTLLLDPSITHFSRDELYNLFKLNHIQTKKYFFPPLHKQKIFLREKNLPVTEHVSSNILTLPLHDELSSDVLKKIISLIHAHHSSTTKAGVRHD